VGGPFTPPSPKVLDTTFTRPQSDIITNNGTGSFTINFKQVGYSLCGASVTPIVASPGTAAVQSGVIKAFSSSGKTCNVQLLKGDGSAVVPADADLILVTLIFRDSVGV
jgi:hypothetical protein